MPNGKVIRASGSFNAAAAAGHWPSLCDPTLAFAEPEFGALLDIWRSAASEGRLPRRVELDLRRLKNVLPVLALYERVANGRVRYRVRVMGTAFADAIGDLSGQFVDEAVSPQHLPRWQAALDAAFEAGAPLRFLGQLDLSDKPYMVAEYFEAPLLAYDGTPNLILAAGHFVPGNWTEMAKREASRLKLPHFR